MKLRIGISAVVALLLGLLGGVIANPQGDPAAVLARVDNAIRAELASRPAPAPDPPKRTYRLSEILASPAEWRAVERTWSGLSRSNQEIATARAMLHYGMNPTSERDTWERRHEIAARPWRVEELQDIWLRRAGYACVGVVVGFGASFAVLALLVWSWAFMLARVRELSGAARGKGE